MNRLTINHGSFNLDEIDLDHGTITIGRAVDNDIRLDDSAVSSHHAKIVTFFNVTYIEDLDSTNGTIVNGRAIKKYTLRTGDIVLLGKHQLLFQGTVEADAAGNGDATMVMTQADVKDAMATAPEKTPPAAADPISVKPAPVVPTPVSRPEPIISTPVTPTPVIPTPIAPSSPALSEVRPSVNTNAAAFTATPTRQERNSILDNSPPPAPKPAPAYIPEIASP
ncbi:MAG: FHA domain-containing protein, partial [Thiohalomonadales bacterium]